MIRNGAVELGGSDIVYIKNKKNGGGVYGARWLKAVFLRLLTRCSELVAFTHSSFLSCPPLWIFAHRGLGDM